MTLVAKGIMWNKNEVETGWDFSCLLLNIFISCNIFSIVTYINIFKQFCWVFNIYKNLGLLLYVFSCSSDMR